MSAAALEDFMVQPYGILADVKMLYFFLHMSATALAIIAVLALLSVIIKNFWCRYACPYGAVMSIASLFSPFKIRRDVQSCIECGKCAKACPQDLPVDQLVQVRSVECTACMECVASCATQNALQFALPPRRASADGAASVAAYPAAKPADLPAARWSGRTLQPVTVAAVLAVLFFGGVSLARVTHHWQTNVSSDVYRQLIPHVGEETHPGF
jgi:polyferredoxin